MKKILFSLLGSVAAFLLPVLAMAQEHGAAGSSSDKGLIALAAAFAVGIAALGGTLGQSKAAATALLCVRTG